MAIQRNYKRQVGLLLRVLPEVGREKDLALHGGTAINLFDKNMSRLSIDIDLTYLPIESWERSITRIQDTLLRLKARLELAFPKMIIIVFMDTLKLLVKDGDVSIKIEVNPIKRGCYRPPVYWPLCKNAQQEFKTFTEIQVVNKAHLYGGKICAALDRQHPRDLFDIKHMLKVDGFTTTLKKGFLFYLISSNRPIEEMLFPHLKDQKRTFENQFTGMTAQEFTYAEFNEAQENLIGVIHQSLNEGDKQFLIQLENGTPDWEIYNFQRFPAVRWKLINIKKLKEVNPVKHQRMINSLQTKLEMV